MSKRKGFLRKISRGVVAVAKTPREFMRIADQAIDWANDVTDKSGLGKHFSGSCRVGVTRSSGRNGGTNLHYQQSNHSPVVGLGINNQGTPAAFVNNLAVLPLTAPRANFQIDPQARAGRAVNVQQTTEEENDNSDTPVIETNRDNSIVTVNSTQLFRRTDDFALAVNVAVQPIFQPESGALITIQPAAQSRDNLSSRINIESHNLARWQENYGGKPTVSRVLWMYATNQLLPKDSAFVSRALAAGVVDGIRNGEEQTFGRVRAATDAIVSYFDTDRAIRQRYSQISGARIDMTSMSYAAPALARIALSVVPKTPVELCLAISPAPVLFGVSKALKYGSKAYCMANMPMTNRLTESLISSSTPSEIAWGYGKLSSRQEAILQKMPNNLDIFKLRKSDVNIRDLASLTAFTGAEFTLFTRAAKG